MDAPKKLEPIWFKKNPSHQLNLKYNKLARTKIFPVLITTHRDFYRQINGRRELPAPQHPFYMPSDNRPSTASPRRASKSRGPTRSTDRAVNHGGGGHSGFWPDALAPRFFERAAPDFPVIEIYRAPRCRSGRLLSIFGFFFFFTSRPDAAPPRNWPPPRFFCLATRARACMGDFAGDYIPRRALLRDCVVITRLFAFIWVFFGTLVSGQRAMRVLMIESSAIPGVVVLLYDWGFFDSRDVCYARFGMLRWVYRYFSLRVWTKKYEFVDFGKYCWKFWGKSKDILENFDVQILFSLLREHLLI